MDVKFILHKKTPPSNITRKAEDMLPLQYSAFFLLLCYDFLFVISFIKRMKKEIPDYQIAFMIHLFFFFFSFYFV